MKKRVLCLPILFSLTLTGCLTTTLPNYRVHHSFVNSPTKHAPKKVLLFPPDITVKELSAGGVAEEVVDWSRQASNNVEKSLQSYFGTNKSKNIQLVGLPKLSEKDVQLIRQHLALYRQVVSAAFEHSYGQGIDFWPHKVEHFDYTLGSGLKFLKNRTGADSAIVVIGDDRESSGGRKAAQVVGAILPFVGGPQRGNFALYAGIVDLNSGNLLWLGYYYDYNSLKNFRSPKDALTSVQKTFDEYPGIEQYSRSKVSKK